MNNNLGITPTTAVPKAMGYGALPNPMAVNEGIHWVESEDEVKNKAVRYGDSAAFFHRTEPVFYVKTVDENGAVFPIRTFKYEELEQSVGHQFATKEDLSNIAKKLDDLIDQLTK